MMFTVQAEVAELISIEHPNVTHWKYMDELGKMYYALILEDRVLEQHHLAIYLCKKQWCAGYLLSSAFKAGRARRARAAERAAREVAADNEAGPVVHQDPPPAQGSEQVDDDNASTTSNIAE
ncbi:hypothetical protein [Parasitella parasitica]|uniref:Uncharacterized protein n=1 Tax=Parasitella parasitica TaxID=35722 RepID=A0A0B7NBA6_9FUNG|nr:hypothetical protein [Parasitella parasitica]